MKEHYWVIFHDNAGTHRECICGFVPRSLTAMNQHVNETID